MRTRWSHREAWIVARSDNGVQRDFVITGGEFQSQDLDLVRQQAPTGKRIGVFAGFPRNARGKSRARLDANPFPCEPLLWFH